MRRCYPDRFRRRAAVVVQVAVMSTLIMGFGALAIDVGMLYVTKTDLQAAADSAALAGAAQLAAPNGNDPESLARAAAKEFAERHRAFGSQIVLDEQADVEMGKAVFNPQTEKFEFQPASTHYDSVRVTVRRTEDWENAMPLLFGNIFGASEQALAARAAAVLIPRDIAVVIDLSNSMCWDSQLRFYNRDDGGYSNLRDVWCALDGPEPSRPYIPGSELETEYAADTGPTYGQMVEWGDPLIPGAYDPATDPGLIYLPRGESWHSFLHDENVLEQWPANRANTMLLNQGYDVWERWAVLTNECMGYLTAPATNGLGFTSRAIWRRNYDGQSHDKITVYLTSDNNPSTPGLSNVQISVPAWTLSYALSTAHCQGSYTITSVNPDPQTGLVAIKFEGELGEDGAVETKWFSLSVPTNACSSVKVACKAGPNWSMVTHTFASVDPSNTTRWRLRAATVLGLVQTWHSGMGSHPGGDADGMIEGDSEVTWLATPDYALNWNWKNYMDRVRSAYPAEFAYRFGLKTYTDFLMEKYPESFATDGLWATPEQPLRAVKDAVQTMVNVIAALESLDHLSLEIFATTARHQIDLTDDLQSVADTLYQRQSGHWDRSTNMGGGLQKAIEELKSPRARSASAKVIVLMSDGVPNVDAAGNYLWDGAEAAVNYAYEMAEEAANEGFRIYCVSVGYSADREVMQTIAAKGHGQEFYAAGSPEEYTEQLQDIFRTLGGKRPVALIE